MFKLFLANKRLLGVNYTKFFKRNVATIVSYAATVYQTFKVNMFSDSFSNTHYVLQIFIGGLNALISRVKNSAMDIAVEYFTPFFILPLFFFNVKFRTHFSNYIKGISDLKFSLWLSSVYSNLGKYRSASGFKEIAYADYDFKFIAI